MTMMMMTVMMRMMMMMMMMMMTVVIMMTLESVTCDGLQSLACVYYAFNDLESSPIHGSPPPTETSAKNNHKNILD